MIRRRKPLKRSSKPLRRTPLRRVSKKHGKSLKEYFRVRAEYLAEHQECEAGPIITRAPMPDYYVRPICTGRSDQVHHMAKRGPNLCRKETFCACCKLCHEFIHQHAQKSRELGLLM